MPGDSHPTQPADLPSGYILFSAAIRRLHRSMWGGLQSSFLVSSTKAQLQKAGLHKVPVGSGPWRERAGKALTHAARQGKLAVYVAYQDETTSVCTRIPSKVLLRLITPRGRLPDRAFRPSIGVCDQDHNLFLLLQRGCLVVDESQFTRWLAAERKKRKWPSQAASKKRRPGRPRKQTQSLENAILGLVHDGAWNGSRPITQLKRLLTAAGRHDVPSADTLCRLVDALCEEKGDPLLLRRKRASRTRSR